MTATTDRLQSTTVAADRAAPGRGRRWFAATGWRHIVGILLLFFALFPVWFVIIAAFSESGTLSGQTLVPESFTTKQYDRSSTDYPYWNWFFNSLIVSSSSPSAPCSSPRWPPTPSPGCGSRAAGPGCSPCC